MVNDAVLAAAGGGFRLAGLRVPSPPSAGEVLVRMLRAPINPADLLAIDGRYAFATADDAPLGAEGVGVVEAVGESVTRLAAGDRVLPLTRGNWCRFRTVAAEQLIRLPRSIDIEQASMLRINPATAKLLLGVAAVAPGSVLVQNAAGSAVATWVRALAKPIGLTVIDIVRRTNDRLPDAIVDGPALAQRVRAAAEGRPITAALDCVAGVATGHLAGCLHAGGRLIVFGHLSGRPIEVASQLLTANGLSIQGFSLRPAEAALRPPAVDAMFEALLGTYQASGLVQPIRDTLPLTAIEAAVALAREDGPGRILLNLER